jgi:hypothetical protein
MTATQHNEYFVDESYGLFKLPIELHSKFYGYLMK